LNHISDIFQKTTGKPLIVTSGNDSNIHAGGEFSHGNGWKVDVSGNGLEDPKIRYPFIKQCESLGITVRDEYDNPSPNSTGGHLDLTFNGYKGNVRKKRNGFGSVLGRGLPLSPKEYARRQKEALAERRAEAREARAEARAARQEKRDEVRLALDLKRLYGEGTGKTKGMTKEEVKKYENAKRDFTISGRKLSELEGKENLELDALTGKTKNPYEEEMKNATKHLDAIFQVESRNYDLSKATPL
jgi:hypothetical protein